MGERPLRLECSGFFLWARVRGRGVEVRVQALITDLDLGRWVSAVIRCDATDGYRVLLDM